MAVFIKALLKAKLSLLVIIIFIALSAWWVWLNYLIEEPSDSSLELFSGTYGVLALIGAISGLIASKKWGGRKSYMGSSIMFFSLGLLAQEFGQITYSLYTLILNREIPYPSLGDIGYFGSIPLYIIALFKLSKVCGIKISVKAFKEKIIAIIIPLAFLGISYFVFLRDYEADWGSLLTVLLDFGYPLGQSIYISLALLVYLFARKYLGGIMRPAILFLLFALVMQYIADFTFLYQNHNDSWQTAGVNDYIYLVAYLVMTLALIGIRTRFESLLGNSDNKQRDEEI